MASILVTAVPRTAIYRFGSAFDRSVGSLPGYYASKSFTGEDASMRVKWRSIVFHGEGTMTLRVYIDNVLVMPPTQVTMADHANQLRVTNLPRGRSTGYALRYEYEISVGYVRFAEIYYEPMTADVN